ncbi:MAG: HAD family phosphatase [Nitrospirota bacterium]|nr:HAD family phosphatase [Nitrospirota bacterium]
MIKAIIFDYGNVISSVDNDLFLKEISAASGKTGAELDAWVRSGLSELRQFESGAITSAEFFDRAVRQGGLGLGEEEFIKMFTGRFTPIKETRDLMRQLKRGYRLGLLSNTNAWDFEYEIMRCDVFSLFDTVSVSFRVGAMKPDSRIYLDALNKLGYGPRECVYIDDIKEYAEAANALGINGLHHTSHEDVVSALRKLNCLA